MGAPIRLDWEEADAHLAFDSSRLVLAAPQLVDGVYTSTRIASIAWIDPDEFDVWDPAAGRLVETAAGEPEGVRLFALEHGATYQLRLRPAGRAQLQLRGPLRYRELYQRLGGMEVIRRLSTAFYTHVLETGPSTSLRAAFAGKVDGVAQAAANQSEWFASYFGRDVLEMGAEQRQVQRRLLGTLVPKHPDALMSGANAVVWLGCMCQAVDETLPPDADAGWEGEAVLRFALHFLAFFDYSPPELCAQRAVVDGWLARRKRGTQPAAAL